jgi:hypothetical protein
MGKKDVNNGLSRRGLKAMFDEYLSIRDVRSPMRKYPHCILLGGIIIFVFLTLYAVTTWFIYKSDTMKFAAGGYFWHLVLTPVVFIMLMVLFCCIGKRQSDKNLRIRVMRVFQCCENANNNYGWGGWRIVPGEYAAWLELWVNPQILEMKNKQVKEEMRNDIAKELGYDDSSRSKKKSRKSKSKSPSRSRRGSNFTDSGRRSSRSEIDMF